MEEPPPVLMGRRILLREPRPDDADTLFQQTRIPAITRFLAFDPPATVDETLIFIARSFERRRQDREYTFVVAEVASDAPLGIIGLRHIELPMRTAQIGSWVAQEQWGAGVNAEAKRLLLDYAFGPLGLHRIEARIAVDNVRSWRAFERLGGVREGLLKESFVKNGQYHDQYLYAILARLRLSPTSL